MALGPLNDDLYNRIGPFFSRPKTHAAESVNNSILFQTMSLEMLYEDVTRAHLRSRPPRASSVI